MLERRIMKINPKLFLLSMALVAEAPALHAQGKDTVKYRSAKDYIREKEETDPNMHRRPGDRIIKLDEKFLQREANKSTIRKDSIRKKKQSCPASKKP